MTIDNVHLSEYSMLCFVVLSFYVQARWSWKLRSDSDLPIPAVAKVISFAGH